MDNLISIAKDPLSAEGCGRACQKLSDEQKAYLEQVLNTVRHDIQNVMTHSQDKEVQGTLAFILDSFFSSITYIASAAGWFWMYKTLDVASTTLQNTNGAISAFLSKAVEYIEPLMFLSSVALAYYKGALSETMLVAIVSSYAVGKFMIANSSVGAIISAIVSGASAQSTLGRREAQAATPVGFVSSLFALTLAIATIGGDDSAKILSSAFRTIGSSLLAMKTLEEVLIGFFERLPDFFLILVSHICPSLGLYIRLKSDKDLEKLLSEVSFLSSLNERNIMYNSHYCSKFIRVYNKFESLIVSDRTFTETISSVRPDVLSFLDNMRKKLVDHGLWPGRRVQPFVIWIDGEPGIGKSSLVRKLANHILTNVLGDTYNGDYSKYTYFMNSGLPFMDGYHNQPITVINDYLQFASVDEESLLIKAVDTTDWYLNVSSVDNPETGIKGEVRFTSQIIIVTSNVRGMNTTGSGVIKNLEAFNRRRDVCVTMKRKPNVTPRDIATTPNWDYSWVTFVPFSRDNPFNWSNPLPENLEDPLLPFFQYLDGRMHTFFDRSRMFAAIEGDHITLSDTIAINVRAENFPNEVQRTLYERAKDVLHKTLFGVPLYVWSSILVVGSAGYLMYKSTINNLSTKIVQSASGDETTLYVKRPFKKVRQMKVAQGKETNLDEFSSSLSKNVVKITTFVNTPEGYKASMSAFGFFIVRNILIAPAHIFRRGINKYANDSICEITTPDGELIVDNVPATDIYFDIPGLDVVAHDLVFLVINKRGFEMRKNVVHHFLKDATLVRDSEPGVIMRCMPRTLVNTPVRVVYSENTDYYDRWGARFSIPTWDYNVPFSVGDCGSLLLLTRSDQPERICGMHVCGNNHSGSSCVLTQDFLTEAVRLLERKQVQGECEEFKGEDNGETWFDAEEHDECFLEWVGLTKRPIYQNTRSDIIPSPFFELLQDTVTAPAVLRPGDPRLEVPVSPAYQALRGYSDTVVQPLESYNYLAQKVLEEIYSPIGQYKLETPNLFDNINSKRFFSLDKLKLDTSPGYPHVLHGKTKRHYFSMGEDGVINPNDELVKLYTRIKSRFQAGEYEPINVASLKDERVSLEKVKIGKTRVFIIPPLEYTLLTRELFGDFIDKEITLGLEASTTVGVNPYSKAWDYFYKLMHTPYRGNEKLVHFIDGDFPFFDKRILLDEMQAYGDLVNYFYGDDRDRERDQILRSNAISLVLFGNKIFRKKQGNNSGFAATTSLNSFVCKRRFLQCLFGLLPVEKMNVNYVLSNCRIVTHGDDHIIAVSEDMFKYFDGLKYKQWNDEHGFGYTASIKGSEIVASKPLHECFYLKNFFRYDMDEKAWMACLKKEVIQEMVSWQHRCEADEQTIVSEAILQSAQKYAWFWGYSYFSEITSRLKQAVREKRMRITLLDYGDVYNLYNTGSQMFSWL